MRSSTAGTIVVGVDSSDSSMRALAWAAEQAAAERRALTLVHTCHAVTPAYMDAAIAYPEEARRALRTQGQKILDAARAEVERTAPGVVVEEIFQFADPREVLLELSAQAAMVVLGSRGRGTVRSLLLGSVGTALVRHAECPVVVHRPGNPGTVRHGIAVGIDASEESLEVLEFAYREASLRRLPLTVVHAYWDVRTGAAADYPITDTVVDVESERLLVAEAVAGMSEKYPDVPVGTRMEMGLAQRVLVRLSERMNLVVVGTHRASRIAQLVMGSVSLAVVEHAACPVAVVPMASREHAGESAGTGR